MKNYDINVDIKRSSAYSGITVVQGDSNSNQLDIDVYDNSLTYVFTGLTPKIFFKKPDGTVVIQDTTNGLTVVDANTGKLSVILNTQTIAAPGIVQAEIAFYGGSGQKLTSAIFQFNVRASLDNGNPIESSNELTALTNALNQVNAWDDQFETKYNGLEAEYATELTQAKNTANANASEIVNARKGEVNLKAKIDKIDSSLADIMNYETFYKNPKSGKKIVFVGDSTTDIAPEMYNRLAIYTQTGGLLEGATIVNRGSNGNTLNRFINNLAYNTNTIDVVLSDKADLYVVCYGINDIRDGSRTSDQIKADMKTLIDRILNETSAYVLLRIPNTFLSTDPTNAGLLTPLSNAQLYSDQLYGIYESFRGYNKRLDIVDIPNLVMGRKSLPLHPYMKDTLHPNDNGYRMIAEVITEHITTSRKHYDTSNYNLISEGTIESATSSLLTIATLSNADISIGDTVIVGNKLSFVITSQPKNMVNKWVIPHNNMDYSRYGKVRILRSKDAEIKSAKNTPYKPWVKVVNNEGAGEIISYATTVIDLQSLGLTGIKDIYTLFNYFTSFAGITQVSIACWLNNNSAYNNIVGGVNKAGRTLPVLQQTLSKYSDIVSLDFTGQRYLHLLVGVTINQVTGVNFEFGDVQLTVDGNTINMDDVAWYNYNALAGSTIGKVDNRNSLVATSDYVKAQILASESVGNVKSWNKTNFNKSSLNYAGDGIHLLAHFDISSLGLTGVKDVSIKYKYYTENSVQTIVFSQLFANASATTLSGANVATTEIPINLNTIAAFSDKVSLDLTGATYLHLLINTRFSAPASNVKFEWGEVEIIVNGQSLVTLGITWENYQGTTGTTVSSGVFRRDITLTYSDLINELVRLGLITS